MEPEKEKTGRLPRESSQRRRVPDWLMRTPEVRISRSNLVDRQPEPKRAQLSGIEMAENCKVTHVICSSMQFWVNLILRDPADIIGLPNQTAGYLPKTMGGFLPSASTKPNVNLQNDPIIQKHGSQKVGLLRCLLTEEEMKTFDFPLQGSPD
ncbi:Hypothetical predicted protein [Marmota monax]|uniref:Uncharacterized protein n=1 Tax=Marmota monax TaxID=9995 RepID=A0A5E4BVW3_MARMO|nr:Hypothetical predicted protein [Marmota monax]